MVTIQKKLNIEFKTSQVSPLNKYSNCIEIFNNENYIPWDGSEEMRIVTHHWGANWNKGFDIYVELDKLISSKKWKNKISFCAFPKLKKKKENI